MRNYTIAGKDVSDDQKIYLRSQMSEYKRSVQADIAREVERKSSQGVEVTVYADMVKVHADMQSVMVGGGLRGECKGFSDDSRRRLIQRMAQWNLSGLYCAFITLTYPIIYSEDWHVWKRDLETYVKRLERKYPHMVGCCWRVEFQKRGAPHFHLIVAFDEPICTCGGGVKHFVKSNHGGLREVYWHKPHCKISPFRSETSLGWASIIRDGYLSSGGDREAYRPEFEKSKKAGTCIDALTGGRRQLMCYVSKYLAKTDQASTHVPEWGRNWGFKNINGVLDFEPMEVVNLNYREAVQLLRLVRRWLKSRGKGRYAGRLAGKSNYSVLGLGADSESGRVLYRMLGGVSKGLFAPHILPSLSTGGLRFIDRVALGLVALSRPALIEGMRITTPLGSGHVTSITDCPILKRARVAVLLDDWHGNSKYAVFEVWEVKPIVAKVTSQAALW